LAVGDGLEQQADLPVAGHDSPAPEATRELLRLDFARLYGKHPGFQRLVPD